MDAQEFRTTGHYLVDLLAEYLATIEERPLFPNVEPRELHRMFDEALPQRGLPVDAVVREIEDKLIPYSTHVGHRGTWG
jgi:hypothetical protein